MPDGGIDRLFASLGAAFGRDQNGYTRLDSTSYKLDLTDADEQAEIAAFSWARDVGDGILFTATGVATERGVVVAEREAADTPTLLASRRIARFQLPQSRTIVRFPEGDGPTLARATPESLTSFYRRWYRPENAILIVVGDRSLEEMEARVRATFKSWHADGFAPKRAVGAAPDTTRDTEAFQLSSPTLFATASACRFRPPESRDDPQLRLRRQLIDGIWSGALNKRFRTLVEAGGSHLLGATAQVGATPEYASTCMIVVPGKSEWQEPFAAAQAEWRRFAEEGLTEQELEEQIEGGRAIVRGAITSETSRTAEDLADTMLARILDGDAILSPREALHAFDIAVEDVDPPTVLRRFKESWSGAGPLLALVTPDPVSAGAVKAAWLQNDKAKALLPYADQKKQAWVYPASAKAGAVISREKIADPAFTRIRFENGLILNFKQLETEKNKVDLIARFGAGRSDLPDTGVITSALGTILFTEGGLGKMTAQDINTSLAPVDWRFRFSEGPRSFQWSDSVLTTNLATQLQVFAAFFTDPGFRQSLDERIGPAVDIMYRTYSTQPEMALSSALEKTLDPGNPGNLPDRAAFPTIRSADFARLLGPVIRGAPIELTIVGDIDQASVEELVGGTLGALPPRHSPSDRRRDPRFLRFPDHAVQPIRAVHEGPSDRAIAELVWPLYVATPERRREERALKLVAAIFNQKLRDRVRGVMGKTYSPEVATSMPDYADQGYLTAVVQSNPSDVHALANEAMAVARTIATGEFDQTALDAARRPMLAALASQRGTNAWWASALSGSATDPAIPAELTGFESMLNDIKLDEVKTAAQKWLSKPPIVAVVEPSSGAAKRSDAASTHKAR